jgi:chromosome segregation ATPase
MYDKQDVIAEELSNYCQELRSQLKDSKATITWLCDSKSDLQKKLSDLEDRLRIALQNVHGLEEMNVGANERIAELEGQLNGALS